VDLFKIEMLEMKKSKGVGISKKDNEFIRCKETLEHELAVRGRQKDRRAD
jgi:hypothetical protein